MRRFRPYRATALIPQPGEHPSNRKSQTSASNEVAQKMIVGAQLSNGDRSTDHIDWTETRPADPEYRHDRADGNHMTGWERCETRASVKWIEVVDAIPDE